MAIAAVLLLTAPIACADTIETFNLTTSYQANFGPDGTASGAVIIDSTIGTIDAINLSFAAIPDSVFPLGTEWDVFGSGSSAFVEISEQWDNAANDDFFSILITLPVNTLVGYSGGLICSADDPCDGGVKSGFQFGITQLMPYTDGQLTGAPEPPYLALLGAGVLCLFEIFRRRSFRASKQVGTVPAH
jgi:hypothetical protein